MLPVLLDALRLDPRVAIRGVRPADEVPVVVQPVGVERVWVLETLRVIDHAADGVRVRAVDGHDHEPRPERDLAIRTLGLVQPQRGTAVVVPAGSVRELREHPDSVRDPDARRSVGVHRDTDQVAGLAGFPARQVGPGGSVRDEARHLAVRGRSPEVEGTVILHRARDVATDFDGRVGPGRGLAGVHHQVLGVVPPARDTTTGDPDRAARAKADAELGETGRGGERAAEGTAGVSPDTDLAGGVQDAEATRRTRGERAVGLATRRVALDAARAEAREATVGPDGAGPLRRTGRTTLPDHGVGEVHGRVRADAAERLGLPAAGDAAVALDLVLPGVVVVQPRNAEGGAVEGLQRADLRQIRQALFGQVVGGDAPLRALLRVRGGGEGEEGDEEGSQGSSSKASE